MEKKEVLSEVAEITAKTLLSVIPVGGTLVTCIWDSIKANSANRRMEDWKKQVEEKLCDLNLSLDAIGNNELFASAMMKATDIALKTAEDEKRQYLASAVKNSATASIDESVMMIYLDLLDKYTLWHIRILHLFRNPKGFEQVHVEGIMMGSASIVVEQVYPEIAKEKELLDKIVKDLQNDGMMAEGSYMHSGMTSCGVAASRTTELGNKFLKFILDE